ncbi:MAG: substrate-binding domain-containing protein [Verrucomicrobia bacterium]|nr:substrate-binding domain-containing protein [Verrucomicrobiota bacterium]
MDRPLRIAIILSPNTPWHRSVLGGIPSHVPLSGHWEYLLTRPDVAGEKQLLQWKPDGVLGSFNHMSTVNSVLALKVPAVNVSENISGLDLPCVLLDCNEAGRMAADHLREVGLHQFAYAGWSGHGASPLRYGGFKSRLEEMGLNGLFSVDLKGFGGEEPIRTLLKWLPTLPRPIGIFAFNDIAASTVIQAAQALKFRVPDDMAVLGVDNDEAICAFTTPQISSIQALPNRIGRLAAELLDYQLCGKQGFERRILVAPRGVVARASTDHLAIDDEAVTRAVRFIRTHAGERINVADVVRMTGIGRRVLEKRMSQILGHSPLEEIQRSRIKLATRLLVESPLELNMVAVRSGFRDLNHLVRTFRERLNDTPANYRRHAKERERI